MPKKPSFATSWSLRAAASNVLHSGHTDAACGFRFLAYGPDGSAPSWWRSRTLSCAGSDGDSRFLLLPEGRQAHQARVCACLPTS